MTGIKFIGFSISTLGLTIAQMIPEPILDQAKTLERATPTYVLAVVSILLAWNSLKQTKRIDQLTDARAARDKEIMDTLLAAIQENTEASTELKAWCKQRSSCK